PDTTTFVNSKHNQVRGLLAADSEHVFRGKHELVRGDGYGTFHADLSQRRQAVTARRLLDKLKIELRKCPDHTIRTQQVPSLVGIHPQTRVANSASNLPGNLEVALGPAPTLHIDHIATAFRPLSCLRRHFFGCVALRESKVLNRVSYGAPQHLVNRSARCLGG